MTDVVLSVNFPIEPEFMQFYDIFKKMTTIAWRHDEVLGSGDRIAYLLCDPRVQKLYVYFLKLLVSIDDIVAAHWAQIVPEEVRAEFIITANKNFIEYMEIEHAFTYKKFITEFVDDPIQRRDMFTSFTSFEPIIRLLEYSKKYVTGGDPNCRMFANLLIEHVFLPVIFTFVGWTAEKSIGDINKRVPGFIQANTFIMTDEALHAEFAMLILTKWSYLIPKEITARQIADEFMAFVQSCNEAAFEDNVPGINANILNNVAIVKMNELFMRFYSTLYSSKPAVLPGYSLATNATKKESNFETNAAIYSKATEPKWSEVTDDINDF